MIISHINLNEDLCAYTSPLHSTKMLQGANALATAAECQFQRSFLNANTNIKSDLRKGT